MKFTASMKNNYEFRRLYQKGKCARTPCLVVYARTARQTQNRLGLTVSTKVGHAVVRNRIRRRLREIYRLHEPGFRQGVSLVIVARARAASADYHRLETELLKACRQLEIYADVQSAAQAPASGGAEG